VNDRNRFPSWRVVSALILAAALVTGCGNASGDDGQSADDVFRVGFVNAEIGTPAFPDVSRAALAAASYLNDEEGGVGGRKLELVLCEVGTDAESNQACGHKFANDDDISLVILGTSINSGPLLAALGDKPVLGALPIGPSDFQAKNAVYYYGGAPSAQLGGAKFSASKGPKTIAYFYEDVAAGAEQAKIFASGLDGTGIELEQVAIPSGATDVLPQVTKAKAVSADLVFVSVANCAPVAQALQTLGADGIFAAPSSCVTSKAIADSPALFEGWYILASSTLQGTSDEARDLFEASFDKYTEGSTATPGAQAEKGWGIVLSMAQALKGLSAEQLSDSAAVDEALRAFRGPVVVGTESIECPGAEPFPAVCSQTNLVYQVEDAVPVPVG